MLALRSLLALANGVEEEMIFRGYAVERLETTVHQKWIAIPLAYGFCMVAHWSYWGTIDFAVIGIGQVVFLYMYVLRRRLLPCIIAHVLADLLGVFVSSAV